MSKHLAGPRWRCPFPSAPPPTQGRSVRGTRAPPVPPARHAPDYTLYSNLMQKQFKPPPPKNPPSSIGMGRTEPVNQTLICLSDVIWQHCLG